MIPWRCLHLPLSTPVVFGGVLRRRPQTDVPLPTNSSYGAAASTAWWYQSVGWVCTLVTWIFFFPLQRQNPKDVHTLAQLISAYSLVDPEKAKVYPFYGGQNKDVFRHCFLGLQLCGEFRCTLAGWMARNFSRTVTYPGQVDWSYIISLTDLITVRSQDSFVFGLHLSQNW